MATLTANGKVLHVDLHGDTVRAAQGSMVAFTGNVEFKGASAGGFGAALKRKVAGESLPLMECTGSGRAYLGVNAQYVTVVDLAADTLSVESQQLLAVGPGLTLDVKFAGIGGAMSGQGLATTTVSGNGQVAVLSDGPLMVLEVGGGQPLVVDPDAFVASSGQVRSTIVPGVSWKALFGEGSGEAFSLRFEGQGLVCIQPAER